MTIEFPVYVDYVFFYRFLLGKMMSFAQTDNNEYLTIDLRKTEHIDPYVICMLLSYLRNLYETKGSQVFLYFGDATKLASYLNDSMFFFHAEGDSLFATDIVDYGNLSSGSEYKKIYKKIKTNNICRVNVPPKEKHDEIPRMPSAIEYQIQQQMRALFVGKKEFGMLKLGLKSESDIRAGFQEIVKNTYEHSTYDHYSCSYYTFQYYKKTGLSLACSDTGIGCYNALTMAFEKAKKLWEKGIINDEKKKRAPKIVYWEEFKKYKFDKNRRNLVAILESLVYRVGEKDHVNYGFPYIFELLVLPGANDHKYMAELIIHSEDTLLCIDKRFIEEYFIITEIEECGQRIKIVSDYDKEKLRQIIANPQMLIEQGIMRQYNYVFPGVHVSVHMKEGD